MIIKSPLPSPHRPDHILQVLRVDTTRIDAPATGRGSPILWRTGWWGIVRWWHSAVGGGWLRVAGGTVARGGFSPSIAGSIGIRWIGIGAAPRVDAAVARSRVGIAVPFVASLSAVTSTAPRCRQAVKTL